MLYYSVALLAQAVSWVLWGVFADGQIPTGATLTFLGLSSLVGQALSAVALLMSARALIVRVDGRIVGLILVSLILSFGLSLFVRTLYNTLYEIVVWAVIWPISFFIQLSRALILVSLLGKWYLARPIGYIAFAYIGYTALISLTSIAEVVLRFSSAEYWVIISILSATTFYFVGFFMSQVRPVRHDLTTIHGVKS